MCVRGGAGSEQSKLAPNIDFVPLPQDRVLSVDALPIRPVASTAQSRRKRIVHRVSYPTKLSMAFPSAGDDAEVVDSGVDRGPATAKGGDDQQQRPHTSGFGFLKGFSDWLYRNAKSVGRCPTLFLISTIFAIFFLGFLWHFMQR